MENSPPMGGAPPSGESSRLRPADASHRPGPRSLLNGGGNYPDTGGQGELVEDGEIVEGSAAAPRELGELVGRLHFQG